VSKDWATDAISALDKVIAEMDEWEEDPWEEDPRLIQLSELGLVVMATLVWPVQSRSQAEMDNSDVREAVFRVMTLGGPDAVLDIFDEMDNLGDELSEEGCPMELIFRARGPWSPREFGFSRNVCP
jgi:hypothetical protein